MAMNELQYDENGELLRNPLTGEPIMYDWPNTMHYCYGWVNMETGHCYGWYLNTVDMSHYPGLIEYHYTMHEPTGYWWNFEEKRWMLPDTYPQPENPGPAN